MLLPILLATMAAPPTTFETYCFGCHGDGVSKGSLAIDEVFARPSQADVGHWLALRSRLHHRDMPPEGKPRPSSVEYEAMEAWIEARIAERASQAAAPGRVGPRRLNNVEYARTIEGLFGVSIDVGDRFPDDGVCEGFDTTADVLSLPPLLLEKYFDAAEQVAVRAVHDEGNPGWNEQLVDAAGLVTRGRASHRSGIQWMPSRAAAGATFETPRNGTYLVRFGAFGQQAGDEPVKLQLRVNEQPADVVSIPATQSEPGSYERSLELPAGLTDIEVVFINDYYHPDHPDPSQRDRNAAVQWLSVTGPVDVVEPTAFQASLPVPLEGEDVDSHLGRILSILLPRTWRRPVADEEIDRLLSLSKETAGEAASLETRLRTCIVAMLVSPSFLIRVEQDSTDRESIELSSHELATRLSYFLWSTTPDDILLDSAARGDLASADGRRDQVDRLLRDPRSRAIAENFATQWLQIRALPDRTPDPRRFPGATPSLLLSMQEETIMFFDSILREDETVWSLLSAESTFVDASLAEHYGLKWPDGAEGMQRINIANLRPRGIIGHASILTSTSNPTRTSPVKRGKWVLEVLLDDPPPPPPPDIIAFPEVKDDQDVAALQDMLALHTSDPGCRSCHARMDPLGLAMESLDAVGHVRTADSFPGLDLQATLPGGRTFHGPEGLQKLLIGDPAFLRSLARHMLVYALGRGTTFADEALVLHLVSALQEEPTMRRLILEIVESEAFRMRSAPGGDVS